MGRVLGLLGRTLGVVECCRSWGGRRLIRRPLWHTQGCPKVRVGFVQLLGMTFCVAYKAVAIKTTRLSGGYVGS